ncbi:MAG: hypothetical protein WKG01_06820 [Kofleriaceae bacterium]
MSLPLSFAVLVCAAPVAYAERAIGVEVTFAAPFDADELREALRMRLPADGPGVAVRVTLTPTGIQVETRDGVRAVDVEGLRGPAAARLVALAASDLMLDDLASAPVSAPSVTARIEPPATSRITVGVLGGIAGWGRMLGGAAIDVTLPRGRGLFAIELGGSTLLGTGIDLTAGIARVGAGLRLGMMEVRGSVVLAPVFVSSGTGDSTVLAGGGASIRMRVPVASRVHAVFGAGIDAFATRTEYRLAGMTALTTPRFAPWFGAGMEVAP